MHHDSHGLSPVIQTGLGVFYLLAMLMNIGFAINQSQRKNSAQAGLWTFVAFLFLVMSFANLMHMIWAISPIITNFVNYIMNPVSYFVMACVGLALAIWLRKWLTEPVVAWGLLQLSLFCGGWAMTNADFQEIIIKPDNVPIVLLIYSVGFTTWLGMRQAVINDERMAKGEVPMEKLEEEKVLVWPDLVYTELLCMVVCTFGLIIWAVFLKAPLEQPSSRSDIPNPSKAPWYFLGLQEMLVYFDPWMAGVVLPTFILIGLIALPYIDFNTKGNGYYTFSQRSFAVTTFLIGFIVLWVTLIVLGTFLRGPNWNFFGPFEHWTPYKNVPLGNKNLSEIFWRDWLGFAMDSIPWYQREAPGILLIAAYMLLLPPLLARTILRPFFIKMGFIRFFVLVTLIQFMAALPIKMVLRWTINLKYIVFIPEAFLNI